jgi:hypothetical protein
MVDDVFFPLRRLHPLSMLYLPTTLGQKFSLCPYSTNHVTLCVVVVVASANQASCHTCVDQWNLPHRSIILLHTSWLHRFLFLWPLHSHFICCVLQRTTIDPFHLHLAATRNHHIGDRATFLGLLSQDHDLPIRYLLAFGGKDVHCP